MVKEGTQKKESLLNRSEEGREDSPEVELPTLYCNGFDIAFSLSDVCLIIGQSGTHKKRLYMSFTTAKTLANNLQEALDELERFTDHNFLTMNEIRSAIQADQTSQTEQTEE